jgi:hypothetical protein
MQVIAYIQNVPCVIKELKFKPIPLQFYTRKAVKSYCKASLHAVYQPTIITRPVLLHFFLLDLTCVIHCHSSSHHFLHKRRHVWDMCIYWIKLLCKACEKWFHWITWYYAWTLFSKLLSCFPHDTWVSIFKFTLFLKENFWHMNVNSKQ